MNNRIKEILEYYNLSASRFAETLNTQPSSISHILSGRNKPSVDLLEKIALNFNDINMTWLVTGNGSMLNKEIIPYYEDELTAPPLPKKTLSKIEEKKEDLFSQVTEQVTQNNMNEKIERNINRINENTSISDIKITKEIDQIVIFYKDGSFKNYTH